jgi:monovalent cation:H+ antiporter, CPA1 family
LETSEIDAVLNLLILVVAVTFLSRRLKLPTSVALIFAGVAAALTPRIYSPYLPPNLLLAILLPPIIFESTLRLDVRGILDDANTIFTYAVLGTIITMVAVSLFAYVFLSFSIIESLILGIAIAPTDPFAVISTFRDKGVNKRFRTIVEGEALFNDGVAVVAYSVVVLIVTSGSVSFAETMRISIVAIFGGAAIGVVGGYLVHALLRRIDDEFTEIMIGFLLSFGIYRLAEIIMASGVLATVAAGLILNYQIKNKGGLSVRAVQQIEVFWEFVSFIVTSLAFILIGIYLDPLILSNYFLPIVGLLFFIMAVRYLKIRGLSKLLSILTLGGLSDDWCMGLWWSGHRGVVSVLLILGASSLPLPNIEEMKALVYGIVLGTNIVWGITAGYAAKRCHLTIE